MRKKSNSQEVFVLRQAGTARYFCRQGWVDAPEEAAIFGGASHAARACAVYGLQDMELVGLKGGLGIEVIRRWPFGWSEAGPLAEAA